MLFNSFDFVWFLPLVFLIYWFLCKNLRSQNRLLLIASYIFYGWWDWRYLFLIAGCTYLNYLAANQIFRATNPKIKMLWLGLASVVCLVVLGFFKYYNFFIDNFIKMLNIVNIENNFTLLNIILPVGISFFTFQALSYTIDVYYGKLKPAGNWISFFTFVSFFPQLVAGPIERATNLLPQFERERSFNYENAIHGVNLTLYGLFKKIVIADNLAVYANNAFQNYAIYNNSITSILGAVFFAFQIYCDFSGYSDMARGISKFFGFELMINFDRPYLATSITNFWRCWHISLSTWFKDYVYIPLGGSRVNFVKIIRNIWIVFLVSGFWHGASWTFIFWGALHGLYQSIALLYAKMFPSKSRTFWIKTVISILFTNLIVVFAWIFFRAKTITEGFEYIKSIFSFHLPSSISNLCAGVGIVQMILCFIVVMLLYASYLLPRDYKLSLGKSYVFCAILSIIIIFLGKTGHAEFIYFQF